MRALAYLTDELAALDLASGQLQPYAKPITIKRGSFDVLPDMHTSREAAPVAGRWAGEEWHVPVGARERPHGRTPVRAGHRRGAPLRVVVPRPN